MKRKTNQSSLIVIIMFIAIMAGCKSDNPAPVQPPIPPIQPPPTLPITPPPTTIPTEVSSVADIKSGKFNKGDEVFLYGYLTRQKDDDEDDWYFTDDAGTNEIILDFPTAQVPNINTNILVYGGVEDIGEVDVITWTPTDTKPTEPTVPPVPPPGVTPPALELTTVDDIVKGVKTGEVIMAGQLTNRQDDDCDEWIFNDGTGSMEVEFPSCNVPAVGVPIYIYGKTDGQYEVDVWQWAPQ